MRTLAGSEMKKQNLSILYQDDPNLLCLVREIQDLGDVRGLFFSFGRASLKGVLLRRKRDKDQKKSIAVCNLAFTLSYHHLTRNRPAVLLLEWKKGGERGGSICDFCTKKENKK